jgi:hypothetical protein
MHARNKQYTVYVFSDMRNPVGTYENCIKMNHKELWCNKRFDSNVYFVLVINF